MKKIWMLALCLMLSVFMVSCDRQPEPAPDPEPEQEENAALEPGWWVRPQGYESDNPQRDVFMSGDYNTYVPYTKDGKIGEPWYCSESWTGEKTLELYEPWDQETIYNYKDGALFNQKTGEKEYIYQEKPPFPWECDVEGRWIGHGDPDAGYYLEFKGDTYQQILDWQGDKTVQDEETFYYYETAHQFSGSNEYYVDVPALWCTPKEEDRDRKGPSMTLDPSRNLMIKEDSWGREVFVRETARNPYLLAHYDRLEYMLNEPLQTNWEGRYNTQKTLELRPREFYIVIANNGEQPECKYELLEEISGRWELTEQGALLLHFPDGTDEEVSLVESDHSIHIDAIDADLFF